MAFGLGSLLSLAAPVITETFFGGDKGGGGGGADQTGAALIQAIQAGQKQSLLQERPLEEIEPAESAKERGEYLMRMLQAIQNNETEGRSAMDSVAASLMRDMQAGTGRIQEEPVVQPLSTESPGPGAFSPQERYDVAVAAFGGQPSHTQIIEEPTEEEEKERSSFVNLRDFR